MLGGMLLWGMRLPFTVLADLPIAGLATPRVHQTPLVKTPEPSTARLTLEEVPAALPAVESASLSQAGEAPAAVQHSPELASLLPNRQIDPANEYIYRFMNSYRPLEQGGGCAAIWEMVPDYVKLPNWLTTPGSPQQIYSKISLYFLAAMLIRNNAVDASECDNGGISADNPWVANNCGLAKAYAAVIDWQNRFNQVILDIAQETGVPAQLMKNIFSRESQFWPGIFTTLEEAGFGQLTVGGADVLLMWNTEFLRPVLSPGVDRRSLLERLHQPERQRTANADRGAGAHGQCHLPDLPGGCGSYPGRIQRARVCRKPDRQLQPGRADHPE